MNFSLNHRRLTDVTDLNDTQPGDLQPTSRYQVPAVLRQIAEVAGKEVALTLALKRGGDRIRVPQRAEGSRLAEWVGLDGAEKIVEALAEVILEIPLANRPLANWMLEENYSKREIARMLRVSYSSVKTYTRPTEAPGRDDRRDDPDDQPGLFG